MSREAFMEAALDQARLALAAGEVPIGAVLVIDGQIVARGFNQPITSCDPTAHAEMLVLRDAARIVGNYRLTDADVYVTLEPCLMCVGALVSTVRSLDTPGLNHRFAVTGGVLEPAARDLIQDFFRGKRRASDAPSGATGKFSGL